MYAMNHEFIRLQIPTLDIEKVYNMPSSRSSEDNEVEWRKNISKRLNVSIA